ncbi:MAG: MFS transporter, partial [Acidimicrobiales bacterium]
CGGHVAERLGPRSGMRIGAGLTSIALCGMSMVATSLPELLGFVAVGGVGNAVGQPAVNLYLTQRVRAGSLGLAFGIKQAAIPTAAVIGGLAVPALALTVGWRWAYGVAGLATIAIALAVPASAPKPPVGRRPFHRYGDLHLSLLALLALGHGLGSGAAGTLGAFLVSSAVDSGFGEGAAGVFGAGCAASGIVARVASGAMADRRRSHHLTTVAAMLLLGSLALVALAVGAPPVMAVGGVGAYCLGWGWPGLLNFAIVQANPGAPAAATSITQTGAYLGGLLGPLAFGLTAQRWSYSAAWSAAAVVMAAAAGTVFAAHKLLRPTPSAELGGHPDLARPSRPCQCVRQSVSQTEAT